jgi:hypothetical protein
MSMPVTVRMSVCMCMLASMLMIVFTRMLVPMNIFGCMSLIVVMVMPTVIVPTVIVSFHRPHLT